MITHISRITLYVKNQQEAKKFWIESMGFHVVNEQPMGESNWLEVAPPNSETRFVLYDESLMKHQNPNANTSHPSLILSTLHLGDTHKTLKERGVKIDDIITMPYGQMCVFYDPDDHAYMLREDQK